MTNDQNNAESIGGNGSSDEAWFDDLYFDANDERSPAEIDARILQAAASGNRRRWPMLATAAVLVVAAGILLNAPDSMLTPPSQSEFATAAAPSDDSADAVSAKRRHSSDLGQANPLGSEMPASEFERLDTSSSVDHDGAVREPDQSTAQHQQRQSPTTPAQGLTTESIATYPMTADDVEEPVDYAARDREAAYADSASHELPDIAPRPPSFEPLELDEPQPAPASAAADRNPSPTKAAAPTRNEVAEMFEPRQEKPVELEAARDSNGPSELTAQPPATAESAAIEEVIVSGSQNRALASFSGRGCPIKELYIDAEKTVVVELRQCSNGRWTLDPDRAQCKRYLNVSESELLIDGDTLRWADGEVISCEHGQFNRPKAGDAE